MTIDAKRSGMKLIVGDVAAAVSEVPDTSVDVLYIDMLIVGSYLNRAPGLHRPRRSQDEPSDHAENRIDKVSRLLPALTESLGSNPDSAILSTIAPLLAPLHRKLRPTGWLFLQAPPRLSGYMRPLLDAALGPENFRNQIVWQKERSAAPKDRAFPESHDVIYAFASGPKARWNTAGLFAPIGREEALSSGYLEDKDGRLYRHATLTSPFKDRPGTVYEFMGVTAAWRYSKERLEELRAAGRISQPRSGSQPRLKRYLDESPGKPLTDVWSDIPSLHSRSKERVGQPDQKPLALLSRLIVAGSEVGGVVLDPFPGSATSLIASHRMGRNWIGAEGSIANVSRIDSRLRSVFGEDVANSLAIVGLPKTRIDALALLENSSQDFEAWCMMLIGGEPQRRPDSTGYRPDGLIRFEKSDRDEPTLAAVEIFGKSSLNPGSIERLLRFTERQSAIAIAIVKERPPVALFSEMSARTAAPPKSAYPRLQILTIDDLVNGRRPEVPRSLVPYFQSKRNSGGASTLNDASDQ